MEHRDLYRPKYTITNTVLRNVSLIEAAREVIENAALVPAWEAKFRQDAVVRTIHYGTHLEGNPLSKEEVKMVVEVSGGLPRPKADKPLAQRERDIQEVLNYRQVLKFISQIGVPVEGTYGRVKTKFEPYTLTQLEDIHKLVTKKILPEKEQGHVRKVQVIIRNKAGGDIIFRPPPAPAVPVQLEEFFNWINSRDSLKNDHPIIRAAVTHWELVRIHPFIDGNGRSARAMTLLILFAEGYDVKRFFSIEQYYDQNPGDYYQALQTAGKKYDGDITSWLEYFTDGLAIELSRVKDRVLSLSRDLKLRGKLGRQISLSERQIKVLDYMETNQGQMTTKELSQIIPMTSRDTLLRDMNDLLEKGVVRKVGQTKGARYILNE